MSDELNLTDLVPNPENANEGTERGAALLDLSMREYGFLTPGVLDRDNTVIIGNHRRDAALAAGIRKVRVIESDGSEAIYIRRTDLDLDSPDPTVRDKTREAGYIDNWSGLHIKLSPAQIERDVKSGLNLGKMMTKKELTRLGVQLDKPTGLEESDFDETPPEVAQNEFNVRLGDVWQLGAHVLACGDATDANLWAEITPGLPALCVTSPPYGVGKDYEAENSFDDWRDLLADSFACVRGLRCPLFCVNLGDKHTGNDGWERHTYADLVQVLADLNCNLVGTRIWLKQPAWSQNPYWRNSYKPVDEYEFIGFFAYGKPKFAPRLTDEENNAWGYRAVWEIPSVSRNDIHTAMFPIELPMRCIRLLTDPDALVIEPFSGSGTTLLACEATGRHCIATELSPDYVAVSLKRYRDATHTDPVRVREGAK